MIPPPRPLPSSSFKSRLPVILIFLALTGFLIANYFEQSQQLKTLRNDFFETQHSLTDQLESQGKSIEHCNQVTTKLSEDLENQKQSQAAFETHWKIDRDEILMKADSSKAKLEDLEHALTDQSSRLNQLDQLEATEDKQEKELKKCNQRIDDLIARMDASDGKEPVTPKSSRPGSDKHLPLPKNDDDQDEGGHVLATPPKS